MKSNLISILMPVYNGQEYLKETVSSILNQSYKEFELIIINDGSSDNTKIICDNLEKVDKRIKIIHKENTGVSHTRNVALDNASGKYITFVDSDDLVHKDYLQYLINEELKNNSDLIVCGFIERKITPDNKISDKKKIYKSNEFIKINNMKNTILDFADSGLLNPLWNKLYKRSIIFENNIRFKEDVKTGEDFIFNLQYITFIKNITFVDRCLYYYIRRNNNSITYQYIDDMYYKGVKIHEILECFLNKMNFYNDKNIYILYGNHLMGVFSAFLNLFHSDCRLSYKEKKAYIRKIINREYVCECANTRKGDNGVIGFTSLLVRLKNPLLIISAFKGISLVRKVRS